MSRLGREGGGIWTASATPRSDGEAARCLVVPLSWGGMEGVVGCEHSTQRGVFRCSAVLGADQVSWPL